MNQTADALFVEAMKLSPDDREALAARLYDSLHDDLPLDPAWDAEIARRVEEIRSGKVEGIPAEVVFQKMRERLSD